MACLAIGTLALLQASYTAKYSDALIRLLFLVMSISSPTFMAPFLLAVYGFRYKEKNSCARYGYGGITITLWSKLVPDINGSFVAMLANGITMLLAHYSLPKKSPRLGKVPV